jgi:bacterioferritin (cytochrome b1)
MGVVGVGQTPETSEGLEVKPLKKIKKIYVDTKDYNVIRSVVESSTRPTYHWNEPVESITPLSGVKFVKYRFQEKVWEIVITDITYEYEGMELYIDYIVIFDKDRNEVATVAIRHKFAPDEDEEVKKNYIIRIGDDVIITADSLHELEYYVIEPRCLSCVLYPESISLADLINKLIFYYKKAILSFSD